MLLGSLKALLCLRFKVYMPTLTLQYAYTYLARFFQYAYTYLACCYNYDSVATTTKKNV